MGFTLALAAIGTAVGVAGNIEQGQVNKANLTYQAQVADYNAGTTAAVGESKLEQQQMKDTATINRIKVAQAASGVDVNSGSAPDVVESARRLGKVSELNIRNDAAREAYGYKVQATGYRDRAKQAETAGYIDALSTLVGGASQMTNISGRSNLVGGGGGGAETASSYNPASWVTWGI